MDKRAGPRVPILGQLQGEVMIFQPMQITDIAPGGATVETRFPLLLDSLHDVRLTLGPTSVVVKARVIHSQLTDVDQDVLRYRSGFEFVDVSPDAQAAIESFVQGLVESRGGV